ncbi:MAG TPA: hypothetical protein VG498_01065 [Terriglobales bacterium]|nr:hypothetical protein [Terriglobales bacterium]
MGAARVTAERKSQGVFPYRFSIGYSDSFDEQEFCEALVLTHGASTGGKTRAENTTDLVKFLIANVIFAKRQQST